MPHAKGNVVADFEQAIGITARLYELRRTARDLRGERYADDMIAFKEAIQVHARVKKLELLPAAMELGKNAQAKGEDFAFMLVMAAFVELTEEA